MGSRSSPSHAAVSPRRSYLTSREACARLGIKPATLYAYASRGLVHVVPGRGRRASLYLAADVQRLRDRSRARSAEGAIAGAALNWGEPVLETALVRVAPDTLSYRGVDVLDLCRRNVPFENVAELLWSGVEPETPVAWRPAAGALRAALRRAWRPGDAPPVRLRRAVAAASCDFPGVGASPAEEELAAARQLIVALAPLVGGRPDGAREPPRLPIAARLGNALRWPRRLHGLLNTMLVVVAEHELNASSFAARIASSTRAPLYACLEAALAVHCGTRHGGYSALVEARLAGLRTVEAARAWVRETLAAGHHLEGFGHALYPDGDPRARALLELAEATWPDGRELARLQAVQDEALRVARLRPNLDFGLAAIARCGGLAAGTAGAIFALGRCAGWTAHILEQRRSPGLIRPRAKYVGT